MPDTVVKDAVQASGSATHAYTGAQFLESLRDGRTIYIYGEKVRDVTKHPAFRNSARMVARWYDRFHEKRDAIGVLTDTGSKTITHPFFVGSRTVDDLIKARDAIAELQKVSYGWMGRSPDYKAAFLGTLGANHGFYGEYAENAEAWYRNYGLPIKDKSFALIFTASMDSEGVKLIARSSYEFNAAATGSPFDYPLSSRLDENDSILVFDKVLIPWENVFIYGDLDKINQFFPASGFIPRFTLHGLTRLAVKLDFIAGLFAMAVEATGAKEFRGVQAAVGEVIAWRNLFHGLSDAMVKSPVPWDGTDGYNLPNLAYGLAYRVFAPMAYPRIKELIERHVASGLIYLPSSAADFENEAIRPYLERFVRGSNGYAALDRVKLLKLLWDAIGTEFGGRHELYERNYAGNHENLRIETLMASAATGELAAMQDFARQCMGEYDLSGWTGSDLINPDDINLISRGLAQG
jgi:aromatic ring hydroxylase